ncbi:hypothetical protein [Candidatus Mycalebacterium sp.]
MKIQVHGQIFPLALQEAVKVKKIGEKRRNFNLGSQTLSFSIYEVEMPDGCEISGNYIKTPSGMRLYHNRGGQYEAAYLISEKDEDPLACKHF